MTPDSAYRWPSLAGASPPGEPGAEASASPEALRQSARAEGYQQGFEEGLAKGEAQAKAAAQERFAGLAAELTQVREAIAAALADAQRALPALVANLLRALALESAARTPEYCEELLQEAAQRLDLQSTELTLAVGTDWVAAQPELSPYLDAGLDTSQIELRGAKAFARLDLAALIAEVMQEQQHRGDDAD